MVINYKICIEVHTVLVCIYTVQYIHITVQIYTYYSTNIYTILFLVVHEHEWHNEKYGDVCWYFGDVQNIWSSEMGPWSISKSIQMGTLFWTGI